MRAYHIALIVSVAIFVVGILLSIYLNAMFLFFFLPIGFAWGFGRRGARKPVTPEQRQHSNGESAASSTSSQLSTAPFCTSCGARLVKGSLFCQACGRPVKERFSRGDLR